MRHNIGLYIRVSTEEAALRHEGSLDSQRHRLLSFAEIKNVQDPSWGMVVDHYIDDGISAKDTNRPAFQRMMRDIRKGRINLILVTDLSRLSRNIMDFCVLLQDLKKANAKFLSLKEQFDTSTPAGEMMVFNMINLAQFERKQTSERVSMNFHSRALRGLRNGGSVVLGYEIDPANRATYRINEAEAAGVREIFRIFIEEGTCAKTADRLNREGILPKARPDRNYRERNLGRWSRNSVLLLLRNRTYAGLREINKKHENEDQEALKAFERYQMVKASWPAIIDEKTWAAVQTILDTALGMERKRLSTSEARVFLLSGILRCKACGGRLMGSAAHGKISVHRYYRHRKTKGVDITCPSDWIPADEIEAVVANHLEEVLGRDGHMDTIEGNLKVLNNQRTADMRAEEADLKSRLTKVEQDIEKTLAIQLQMDDVAVGGVFRDKLKKLSDEKSASQRRLGEITMAMEDIVSPLEARMRIQTNVDEFRKGWGKSQPSMKKGLIRRVFQNVVADFDGFDLYYWVDREHVAHGHSSSAPVASDKKSGAAPGAGPSQWVYGWLPPSSTLLKTEYGHGGHTSAFFRSAADAEQGQIKTRLWDPGATNSARRTGAWDQTVESGCNDESGRGDVI